MSKYYIESDGRVFLIQKQGKFVFPANTSEIPFSFVKQKTIDLGQQEIVYCVPQLKAHPTKWMHKEEIPLRDDVDKVVRKAINYSLPRVVVEGIIIDKKGKVLLVKPSRGYNEDSWTLPGGFMVYGETPEQAIVRETQEEISVEPVGYRLLHVYSSIGDNNSYQWVVLFYEVEVDGVDRVAPSHEIEEIRWFKWDEGMSVINSSVMKTGFKEALKRSSIAR